MATLPQSEHSHNHSESSETDEWYPSLSVGSGNNNNTTGGILARTSNAV